MTRPSWSIVVALLLALVMAGGCGGGDSGDRRSQPPATSDPGDEAATDGDATLADVPDLYRRLEPSVVAVRVRTDRGGGEGSGVVVRADKIVTNNHVISRAQDVKVALASGARLDAEVVARDPLTDLAVLDIDSRELPPAELSDALPQIGSLVVAIGNPLGFEKSVTAGIVSGLDRAIPSGGRTPALVSLIQTDAPISPGNSGGALVGGNGEVVGINVAYIPPAARAVSIGFAIPAPTVAEVVEELLDDGEVEHAYLGLSLRPLTPAVADRLGVPAGGGALVTAVEPRGPASSAGMRAGDVIVRVGDRRIETIEDVYAALRAPSPGDRVDVDVVRDEERQTFAVTLAERPS